MSSTLATRQEPSKVRSSSTYNIYNNGYTQVNYKHEEEWVEKDVEVLVETSIIPETIAAAGELKRSPNAKGGNRASLRTQFTKFLSFWQIERPFVHVTTEDGKGHQGYLLSSEGCGVTLQKHSEQVKLNKVTSITYETSQSKYHGNKVRIFSDKLPSLNKISLTYMMSGLSWRPSYCAILRPTQESPSSGVMFVDLETRASIENQTDAPIELTGQTLNIVTGNARAPVHRACDGGRPNRYRSAVSQERLGNTAMAPQASRAVLESMQAVDASDEREVNQGALGFQTVPNPPDSLPIGVSHLRLFDNESIRGRNVHKVNLSELIPWYSGKNVPDPIQTEELQFDFGYRFKAPRDLSPGDICFYQATNADDLTGIYVGCSDIPQVPKAKEMDVMVGRTSKIQYRALVTFSKPTFSDAKPSNRAQKSNQQIRRTTFEIKLSFIGLNMQGKLLTLQAIFPSDNLSVDFHRSEVVATRNVEGCLEWDFEWSEKEMIITVGYDEIVSIDRDSRL